MYRAFMVFAITSFMIKISSNGYFSISMIMISREIVQATYQKCAS